MSDQRESQKAKSGPHDDPADKLVAEAKPDEARMSEIAKRLLSTPPDRQAVGKALAPKRKADKAKGS